MFELVREALALPNPRGVKILVNGRVDIALAVRAAGAHLPADSPAPESWSDLAPAGFLLGVSCHSQQEVLRAAEEGAGYALFGPVFDPLSKAPAGPAKGLAELERAARAVTIPVLALGGITADNKDLCIAAGAAGVAGISMYQRAASAC